MPLPTTTNTIRTEDIVVMLVLLALTVRRVRNRTEIMIQPKVTSWLSPITALRKLESATETIGNGFAKYIAN